MSQGLWVRREVVVAAPVERVWRALTTPEESNRWQTRSFEVDLRVGGRIYLDYGGVVEDGRILELEPPFRLVYQTDDGLRTAWTLTPEGPGTRVRLEFGELPPDEQGHRFREAADFNLSQLLRNLASFLAGGPDLRRRWWRAWAGLAHTTLRPEQPAYGSVGAGSVVLRVFEGSPAMAAGIRPGDVVVAAKGRPVTQYADLAAAMLEAEPGERLVLRVARDGEEREVELVLAARPDGR